MKKAIAIALFVVMLATIMFAEYRYIMHNLKPYNGDNNTVYIEVFGRIDEYYADPAREMK